MSTYLGQPDRDLQCYFQTNASHDYMCAAHTGIAAITKASPTGLTLTGTFHDQFDWGVIEWNRDNQYEHLALRPLPKGDLTGLTISWREVRSDNCVQMDSTLYDWQDWSRLRIFVGKDIVPRYVLLSSHAVATTGGAWDISVTFDSSLLDIFGNPVPTTDIRAIRWTYCSKMVNAVYSPLDYTVEWSNYAVTGTGSTYKYAGQYSQVIHCEDKEAKWTGYYEKERGNFVGGAIAYFDHTATSVTLKYSCPRDHDLYVGSRFLEINGTLKVTVDGGTPQYFDLFMTKSDIGWNRVCRLKVGSFTAGKHTVVVTSKGETPSDINANSLGYRIFFNYIQAVVESNDPVLDTATYSDITLATDWDTAHSLELNPQRVIWNLRTLGFTGRTNHYVGALKWYKLAPVGGAMASGSFQLSVSPNFATAKAWGEGIGLKLDGLRYDSYIKPAFTEINDVARDFISMINTSSTSMWASLDDTTVGQINIHARHRSGGVYEPNGLVLEAITADHLQITTSGSLAGGSPPTWEVDKATDNPVNAATVAWTKSYLEELHSHSMSAVLALSQELAHEPKTSSLAARYSDGEAVWLNTPALQTTFCPDTRDYFKKAFKQLAQIMVDAGVQPFLQFGECQWWYFATRWDTTMSLSAAGDYWQTASSMGAYDSYTSGQFTSRYGGTMHVFKDDYDRDNPTDAKKTAAQVKALYPHECEMLAALIGEYTSAIIDYVKASVSTCKFEVLYPLDVNDGSVPNNINQPPATDWGSAKLDAFKTEGFGYMFSKNLAQLKTLIQYPFAVRDFSRANSRCLLGAYDNTDPFERTLMEAKAEGTGDKVLWAFDQFSMRSFRLPLYQGERYVAIVSWSW